MSGERGVSVCKIAEGERRVDFHDFGTFNGVNDFEAEEVGDVQAGDCWRGAQVFWSVSVLVVKAGLGGVLWSL
jgi:hypothetical protein